MTLYVRDKRYSIPYGQNEPRPVVGESFRKATPTDIIEVAATLEGARVLEGPNSDFGELLSYRYLVIPIPEEIGEDV